MTEKLYHDDSYLFEFESSVIDVREINNIFEVILHSTAFYPESGGQSYDLGYLDGQKVITVYKNDSDIVIHQLESWNTPVGAKVKGVINKMRRLDNMRKHTAQHILSQAFVRVADAATTGAHLGEIESTIELSTKSLEEDIIRKAERLANDIVFENHPVKIDYFSCEELEKLPVRKIPQKQGKLRIVQIGHFECTACGGTHCHNTGEIGLIKITGLEKIRGHIRVSFLCGHRALEDYNRKDNVINQLSEKLTCHFRDFNDSIEKLQKQIVLHKKEISILNKRLIPYEVNKLREKALKLGNIRLIAETSVSKNPKDIRELGNMLCQSFDSVVLLGGDDRIFIFVSENVNIKASKLAELYMRKFDGGGGGGSTFAQIGGISPEKISYSLNNLAEIVKSEIG